MLAYCSCTAIMVLMAENMAQFSWNRLFVHRSGVQRGAVRTTKNAPKFTALSLDILRSLLAQTVSAVTRFVLCAHYHDDGDLRSMLR